MAPVKGDVEANRQKTVEWLDRAAEVRPDLVVFPELCTTGYSCGEEFLDLAETIPGPTTELWARKAREHGFYVIGGLAQRDPRVSSVIYNGAAFIGPDGELVGNYTKVIIPLYLHTLGPDGKEPVVIEEAEIFRRGNELPVFDTRFGRVGIQICQDCVYPELIRVLTFKGAELIVQINNSPALPTDHEDDITEVRTRVHAFDNGVFVALCNRTGSETFSYLGKSMEVRFGVRSHVCDPWGNFVARAETDREELLVAEIDLDQVRQSQWALKFARDWRPELVDLLAYRGVVGAGPTR